METCALLFRSKASSEETACYIVESWTLLDAAAVAKLEDLLGAEPTASVPGSHIGPRKELVSPWSSNATDIARNVGIPQISRIECFIPFYSEAHFDPMVQEIYSGLCPESLRTDGQAAPLRHISDIARYSQEAALALSSEEISYLENTAKKLGRSLSDAEIYGFGQVNSEHCRHKIFNGEFVIDGEKKPTSLFGLIKETSKRAGNNLVSAYKDNVAFVTGPEIKQFAPVSAAKPDLFEVRAVNTVLALKAETHNFPTTVEPFAGAATGSGGEIRDRMAGGQGSYPLAGTAVYMTSYPRLDDTAKQTRDSVLPPRKWMYQTPAEILVKASNGASDFGNKFGQPLINGSLLTFEGKAGDVKYGYDKCIMLAGGIGYAAAEQAQKSAPVAGDKIVVLGGDNYRIGMGGGAVSSVKSGEYGRQLELNAVQRANPQMQKRVYNVIRALCESGVNPIRLVHDHGAGGHMNCLTELVEGVGGSISIDKLPVGDSTLSDLEIICNESQERMGLVVPADAIPLLEKIAERESAPLYVVGSIDGSGQIVFGRERGDKAVDLPLEVLLGSSPRTVITDSSRKMALPSLEYSPADGNELLETLKRVFSLEGVACKDWLTNKVDRSVMGRSAQQQCVGPLQLPLANLGVSALDYSSKQGMATAIGHAPAAGIIDERAGSVLSVIESLTNIVWAPLAGGLSGVSLSANWMWPCKRPGEDARLYNAVESLSKTAIALGIPVPTGKDSLSMSMKYDDGSEVRSPGTVVVTAAAAVTGIDLVVTPDLKPVSDSVLLYLNLSGRKHNPLGGSSLAQALGETGNEVPQVSNLELFKSGFDFVQSLVQGGKLLSGHDVSSGGVLTTLCEMAFAGNLGIKIQPEGVGQKDLAAFLFTEKPGVVLQVRAADKENILSGCKARKLEAFVIAMPDGGDEISLNAGGLSFNAALSTLRACWYRPSMLLDRLQTKPGKAEERFEQHGCYPLIYKFPISFTGRREDYGVDFERTKPTGLRAAIVREQGTNGDREMAFWLFAAGFDVRDVTMNDLITGREKLDDIRFIVFPGGFANSDVLGSGRGWGAAFVHNANAISALKRFMDRDNTLSLGVCNGCQLMVALNLLYPEHGQRMKMRHNASGKFESAFLNVDVQPSNSVLLKGLEGSRLGVWVAHGEGRFHLPEGESAYSIPVKYTSAEYPACPNGADFQAAAVCSADGRHLAMMPHPERAILPWQWPYMPQAEKQRCADITPWMLAFVNAREWLRS